MNKKICHLTSVHPARDARIFHKEAKTLAGAGYDTSLIAVHDSGEILDKIKILPLPTHSNRIDRMTKTVFMSLKLTLREKADIYHFHDPELIPVGILLKLYTGKKVIYDVHEDYAKQSLSKHYLPKITRKGIALSIKILEYLSSLFFDAVVTATNDILKNYSYHRRAVCVRNFPVTSAFSPVKNKNSDVFKIIYVGGLSRERGITEIVSALDYVNQSVDIELKLYGKFSPESYEAEVKSLKGFQKTTYSGWMDYDNVPELLAKADVGIVCLHPISNYLTALPVKLFEYMAAGLPVIASNFPVLKEIVEENNCGICVDPLNPAQIAKAVAYMVTHENERIRMGENGRRAVMEKYNWENESKKLLGLYEDLIGKQH